jgi:putative membrane protein
VPGVALEQAGAGVLVAAFIAVLNAVLPPILAALRLPFTLLIGFILVLWADAVVLLLAHEVFPSGIRVESFGAALLAALVMSAVSVVLQAILGTGDDDEYTLRVTRRIASVSARVSARTSRGLCSWRSTGSRCRCCATRCVMAARRRWRAGSSMTAAAWPSGSPTCPRRPGRAKRGSCSVQTMTFPRFVGWRRSRSG